MTVIQEGNLQFVFDDAVPATKYDDWSFYRNQFHSGCAKDNKAVDFLCFNQDIAYLVEVKDYRRKKRTKPMRLADEIAWKVRDTLAGLVAAQCNATEMDQKEFASQILCRRCIRVVCHLEQPLQASRLHPQVIRPADLYDQLRRAVKAVDPHPIIVDANSHGRAPYRQVRSV